VPAAQFLSRIADRAGLDPDGARRATEAVLQTLAERNRGRRGLASQMAPASCSRLGVQQPERPLSSLRC
jgi:hypothetical protein